MAHGGGQHDFRFYNFTSNEEDFILVIKNGSFVAYDWELNSGGGVEFADQPLAVVQGRMVVCPSCRTIGRFRSWEQDKAIDNYVMGCVCLSNAMENVAMRRACALCKDRFNL